MAGASNAPSGSLTGTFALTAGTCGTKSGTVSGSYFRLAFPGGTSDAGPFFQNANTKCTTSLSYTLLNPGTQHGLVTGSYQADPSPAFSRNGDALANEIIRPVSFAGAKLSLSTSPSNPGMKKTLPKPSIAVAGGQLSGQVSALTAVWDNMLINQGSPKPGQRVAEMPTTALSGSYNEQTHRFVLVWSSEIVGGRFSHFVGYWHLAGTFYPVAQIPQHVAQPISGTKPTTASAKPSKRQATQNEVKLVNCQRVPGGWSAGGTATGAGAVSGTFQIVVYFKTSAGTRLATSSTTAQVPGGGFAFWTTKASFAAPNAVQCVLGPVTETG